MLGDRRLGQTDLLDDVATDAGLLFEKQANDMDARGVAQCFGYGGDFFTGGRMVY